MDRLSAALRIEARRLGFQDLRFASVDPSAHGAFFLRWLDKGYHGEMGYLSRPDGVARRQDLRATMADARSVVVVTQNYYQVDPPGIPYDPSRGVVARYARGEDYHDVIKDRLGDLLSWIRAEARKRGLAKDVRGFPYVDTGPILERELAERVGLGWFGKNTMLIHPKRGSYFFLGVLLLNLPLPSNLSSHPDHCGTCRSCLDACPTGALLGRDETGAPVMDARRCISYLTIELKGPIPRELRPAIGNRVFGCDICQEVCPWNERFAVPGWESAYEAGSETSGPALLDLMGLSDEAFGVRFSGSPVKRAKRKGFLRNVAVALGNWGSAGAVPVLATALGDREPLVRGHAAWALGRILNVSEIGGNGDPGVVEALLSRLPLENDPWVKEELELALGERLPSSPRDQKGRNQGKGGERD